MNGGNGGLDRLAATMRQLVQKTSANGANAEIKQGMVDGDSVVVASRSYPYTLAIDLNVKDGMYVWVNLYNGVAVIVGA